MIEGGKDAVYVGPEQDVTGCPTIPGLKPKVLKEIDGAKFLQEDLPKQGFEEAVVILGNEESDIEWTLQHLPTTEKVTIYNPKAGEESLDCERSLERFLEEDTGCLVTLGSLFNGMECATVVFVFDNPYASNFRANFLRASVELILIDRNQQGSTFILEEELKTKSSKVSQKMKLEMVVQKTLEEARTSHQLDPQVSLQIRMDEAKFEKDHPDYLTGND